MSIGRLSPKVLIYSWAGIVIGQVGMAGVAFIPWERAQETIVMSAVPIALTLFMARKRPA